MAIAYNDVYRRLSALTQCAAPDGPVTVVNLCGPVGVGKSRLASTLSDTVVDLTVSPMPEFPARGTAGPLVFDGVDHDAHAQIVRNLLGGVAPGTCVLAVGRRPLVTRPGWSDQSVETVRLAPMTPSPARSAAP